ncbi:MXAN_6577-like cysteine-rich protein [Pyxidicoccus caerfyrddinensis]|nr:MXAN_6577-like cysteine-rich protein [Pyxidicoccus caerfyrddinensis]
MTREFAITAPSPSLSLGADGRGEVAFTVTNVTGLAMRAVVRLLPEPPLKPEWLSVRGADHRDMPPGATEVFTVGLQVPPGAPPGPYTFRMVVADLDLPDERFAEGPTIAVEVRPTPLPAKPFPWWWLVVGGLVIAGGAVALFLGLRGDDAEPGTCPAGQVTCGDRCIDVRSDAKNCGACGTTCGPEEVCEGGACECTEGRERCGNVCIDTRQNDRNCGACGVTCGAGQFCRDGRCQCPSGLGLCGERCVDTRKDTQNCGACNTRCGANQVCTDGRCGCTGSLTLCGGQCVETDTDEQNCRTCGTRCGPSQQCVGGRCQCNSGLTLCGNSCVNVQLDKNNCGRCGATCATGRTCKNGSCVTGVTAPCAVGQVLCPCTGTCILNTMCAKLCAAGVQPK